MRLVQRFGRRHQFAERLLLGAQRLELGDRGASPLVRAKDRVNDRFVLAAGTLRCPDDIGLVAQESDVDHESEPICAA